MEMILNDAAPAPARRTKRQLQALKTKDRLFVAAVKMINEKGYENVSVEDITSAANVAKGTFYTHFESKEAVVHYTFQNSDAIYLKASAQAKSPDFLTTVTRFVRLSYTEFEKRGRGIMKAMISNYFSAPGRNFYGQDRKLYRCLEQMVEDGKRQQVLDGSRPNEWYISLLMSSLAGIEIIWCFDFLDRSLADMAEDAIRATATGMMKQADSF